MFTGSGKVSIRIIGSLNWIEAKDNYVRVWLGLCEDPDSLLIDVVGGDGVFASFYRAD